MRTCTSNSAPAIPPCTCARRCPPADHSLHDRERGAAGSRSGLGRTRAKVRSAAFAGPYHGTSVLRAAAAPPGGYRPETDTDVLIDVMRQGEYARDRRVLDLGTGSGAIAIAAALAGACSVDLSRRSLLACRHNATRNNATITVHQGDLYTPVTGRRFDLIVSNPPYVPARTARLARHHRSRCWDGGPDGRTVLDRICAGAADALTPDGQILLVRSALSGTQATVDALAEAGLAPAVLARITIPFGPVLRSHARLLEQRGLIEPGQRTEELVVIGAMR